ncbi:MAG TPA: TRAM domain-containing protein [Vicinamibacterales bacterium]|nr:TRAM domain-containing protein [Vicinamibacterales bacterium]
MNRGDRIRLAIERPAAGGRMIARHDGAIVFVAGAIPGEIVEAEIEKVQRGTVWAATRDVLERSPDRLEGAPDGACGGSVFAHIGYERQRTLKTAIIEDSLRRLGHITLPEPVDVVASPIDGYRMRARLHVRGGRIGFFREATHSLCDARQTRQLSDAAMDAMDALQHSLSQLERSPVSEIELSENVPATERAVHLELVPDTDPSRLATVSKVAGLTGATSAPAGHPRTMELWGSPYVSDRVNGATVTRHTRSFFQGNRFLLEALVNHVMGLIDGWPVLDLYAGAGLFSVAAAAEGKGSVVAVEGDPFSAADLRRNAQGHDIDAFAGSVETFLRRAPQRPGTVIVDPPRTGMSKEATAGVIRFLAHRVVYVSCDIATLARDAKQLIDAGYQIDDVRAFDLFPNTAHVETIISFSR